MPSSRQDFERIHEIIRRLMANDQEMRDEIARLRKALGKIVEQDWRGNEPASIRIAKQALDYPCDHCFRWSCSCPAVDRPQVSWSVGTARTVILPDPWEAS